MPTVQSNGITLHYTDTGGTGRPVVLIHGWPLSGDSWSEQIPVLADAGYRVLAYDRRGFGASDKPAEGYDYDTMSADLAGLLEALDLDDVTLVGFSMGGGEVARYVGTHGTGRLHSVVFAAAVPPFLLKTDDNPDGGLADADVQGMIDGVTADREGFLDTFTTGFFSVDGELAVSESQRQQAIELEKPALDAALAGCIDAFGRTDFRADLAAIDVPTLVIHGDSDATVPVEVSGERTAASIEGAEKVVIAKAPHGLNVSHSKEFNDALVEFLAR